LLATQLNAAVEEIQSEMIVISPYFVPDPEGVRFLTEIANQGVRVIVITNSLAATDVAAVHAGYAKYRKDLLLGGIELYEMRPDGSSPKRSKTNFGKGKRPKYLVGSSARASLHAKAFFFDRKTTFIGSLNLDPRSVYLNTEVGVIISNNDLTAMASDALQAAVKSNAYKVSLTDNNAIIWESTDDDTVTVYRSEPHTSIWRRAGVWFMGLFPIESQL